MMSGSDWSLLCRADRRLCALPLESVLETMRPLPIEPVSGAPGFVLGLSIIRGEPVPVVDATRLLGGAESGFGRVVLLRVGERRVGLAVTAVEGIRQLGDISSEELPPLLRSADAEAVATVGTLDAELLVVLETLRLVPEDFLAGLETEAVAS